MNNPLISVIMPVYNAEKYVGQAIESVLAQTYSHFEFLIFNDGSKDGSAEIVQAYARQDARIRFFNYTANTGYLKHLNEGVTQAQGKYIARMDADDICLPKRFEQQVAYLETHPHVGICGTWYTVFRDTPDNTVMTIQQPEEDAAIKVNFLNSCPIGHPTVMVQTQLLKTNHYDQNYYPAEDYELWTRLIPHTTFHNLPEVLLLYRWHGENISVTKSHIQWANTIKAQTNLLRLVGVEDSQLHHTITTELLPPHQKVVVTEPLTAAMTLRRLMFIAALYRANEQSAVFDAHALKTFLAPLINQHVSLELVDYQPQLIPSYMAIVGSPFPTYSFVEKIKFIIKCVIHWTTRI